MNSKTITRFAPSPTGFLHAGNYRTAVFSYLRARQKGGKFILRIEDTDRERSKPEYADNILESLRWLGLDYDEIFYQSARVEIHKKYLEKLIAEDKAYVSKEEIKRAGDRAEVIRFRNPNKKVVFTDLVRGRIEMDTADLGDFVIAKSLNEPIFHLAVVVDDFEMGVTEIIRGEDHISNTPRQILLQEAIGAPTPAYAHLPLVLSPDRSKLSKRNGALSITEYRDQGYLPEAILNYMALLGWNPGDEREVFTKTELMATFDLSRVQKSGAIFDPVKLDWLNREFIKKLPAGEFQAIVLKFLPADFKNEQWFDEKILVKILSLVSDRISRLGEITALAENGELTYFFIASKPDRALLKTTEFLPAVRKILATIPDADFTAEKIKSALWDFATDKGRGEVLWPLRVALSGQAKSPDPFTLAAILGKAETDTRLAYAENLP